LGVKGRSGKRTASGESEAALRYGGRALPLPDDVGEDRDDEAVELRSRAALELGERLLRIANSVGCGSR